MEPMEEELKKLGFDHRFDTFICYYKKIYNNIIYIDHHISDTEWKCTLVSDDEYQDEIYLNYDCTVEWVKSLVLILETAND